MHKFTHRKKLILVGLYLSKFNFHGLNFLGFGSFVEAYNVLGISIGGAPASIKNYRDEFDPLFPNARKGWHMRPLRAHCKEVLDQYGNLGQQAFAALIRAVICKVPVVESIAEELDDDHESPGQTFAKRLITGLAAEQYFKLHHKSCVEFDGFEVEDTTRLGCGFDFKLNSPREYFGVEVKGLNEAKGSVSLTRKEYAVAGHLRDRYFLFVVKNFKEHPRHDIYRNPLNGNLSFIRIERAVTQVNWRVNL